MLTVQDFYSKVTATWEKGKVNHPSDPGGATNDGVATHFITDFASGPSGADFLRSIGIEPQFVMGYVNKKASEKTPIFDTELLMSFSPQQCRDILIYAFWTRNKLDLVPCTLAAFAAFDFSINSGSSRGISYLQRAANDGPVPGQRIDADGKLGPKSFARLGDYAAPELDYGLSLAVCNLREGFLRSLSTFPTFGKGWMARVNSLRSYLKGALDAR